MISYLLMIITFVVFGYFSFSLTTIFLFLIFLLSVLLSFNAAQTAMILKTNFLNLINTPEIISISFFLLSSELFLNSGITKKFKNGVFGFYGKNFMGYFVYLFFLSNCITSSAIFSTLVSRDFGDKEFKDERGIIRGNFLFSVFSFVAPISVPLIVFSFIMGLSLKKILMFSVFYSVIFFIYSYVVFFRKKMDIDSCHSTKYYDSIPIILYGVILYFLIFFVSFPLDVVAEILFLYTICVVMIFKNSDLKKTMMLSVKNAVSRSGIIISVLFFINVYNFFNIYNGSTAELINTFSLYLSESSYVLLVIYIFAFLMFEFLDPLGVIILFFPLYSGVINLYGINPYSFVVSFMFFVSVGLMSNISELPGYFLRRKYLLKTFQINEIIFYDFLAIIILSFGAYYIIR